MLVMILLILLAGYFCVLSYVCKPYAPAARTRKLTKPMSVLIAVAPFPAAVVFTLLFLFVLRGSLFERMSHAGLLFGIWLYAVQFYQYALCYVHKKKLLIGSAAGMVFAVILAVVLTPLDRYMKLLASFLGLGSIFLAGGLLVLFYAVKIFTRQTKNT